MGPGYWEMIPTEIMKKILLSVPTYQLPLSEAWVCKRWTDIIIQPQFWVHKLKIHGFAIDDKIWHILQEFDNNKITSVLYYASLYREHLTQQTPLPDFVSSNPTEEVARESPWGIIPTNEDYKHLPYWDFWFISDNFDNMLMASGVLVCKTHWSFQLNVVLYLKNKNVKALPLLLKLLEARDLFLDVHDDYAFWNFFPRMDYLQILKGSGDIANNLHSFIGCLETLEGIPEYTRPIVSVCVDDKNVAIDPGLSRLKNTYHIHLKAGTNISKFSKQSIHNSLYIFVSGLEKSHILWMTEVTKMFIKGSYHSLVFFNNQLDLKSSKKLFRSMANESFNFISELLCSSPNLSTESGNILKDEYPGWLRLFHSDKDLATELSKDGIGVLGIDYILDIYFDLFGGQQCK